MDGYCLFSRELVAPLAYRYNSLKSLGLVNSNNKSKWNQHELWLVKQSQSSLLLNTHFMYL